MVLHRYRTLRRHAILLHPSFRCAPREGQQAYKTNALPRCNCYISFIPSTSSRSPAEQPRRITTLCAHTMGWFYFHLREWTALFLPPPYFLAYGFIFPSFREVFVSCFFWVMFCIKLFLYLFLLFHPFPVTLFSCVCCSSLLLFFFQFIIFLLFF